MISAASLKKPFRIDNVRASLGETKLPARADVSGGPDLESALRHNWLEIDVPVSVLLSTDFIANVRRHLPSHPRPSSDAH